MRLATAKSAMCPALLMLLSLVIPSLYAIADEQMDKAVAGIREGPVDRMKEYAEQLKSDRNQLIEILIDVITNERALTLAAANSLGTYDKPVVYKHLPLSTRSYHERISAACDILGDLKAEQAVKALLPFTRLGRWAKMPDRTKVIKKDYPAFGALVKIDQPSLQPTIECIKSPVFGQKEGIDYEIGMYRYLLSTITGSGEKAAKLLESEIARTTDDKARQNLRNAIEDLRRVPPPPVTDRAAIPIEEVVIQKDVPYLSKEEAMSNLNAVLDRLKKYTKESEASRRKEQIPEDKQPTIPDSKKPLPPPDKAAAGNVAVDDGTYWFAPLLIAIVVIVAGTAIFLIIRRKRRRAA